MTYYSRGSKATWPATNTGCRGDPITPCRVPSVSCHVPSFATDFTASRPMQPTPINAMRNSYFSKRFSVLVANYEIGPQTQDMRAHKGMH